MSGAESASNETYGFDASLGIQAARKPDDPLEQRGADRKDPEPAPPVSQNHASSVQKIKALASSTLSKMPKVSKIMLCVSGNLIEFIIVHDYQSASRAIIAIRPNLAVFENDFPGVYFEHMYIFARHFDEKLYSDFTDVTA